MAAHEHLKHPASPGAPGAIGATGPSAATGSGAIDPALTYEAAQEELEQIIRRIESGQIGLQEQIAHYQRGVALHAHCKGLLSRFEQQFTDLSAQLGDEAAGASGAPTSRDERPASSSASASSSSSNTGLARS
jgi:exodeoxyribonuclease VII small subunit